MFKITVNGRTHRFATLEAAKAAVSELFIHAGVIVGIEKVAK
jgi:hypothetical protein